MSEKLAKQATSIPEKLTTEQVVTEPVFNDQVFTEQVIANQVIATEMSNKALLTCEKICWQVDQKSILKNISFTVSTGSFTGLIGPNGAGKSTLLRCLYRYLKADKGRVQLQQQDIWKMSAMDYAKQVAVVLQESPSQFNLSVHDVVALGLVPHQSLFANNNKNDEISIAQALKKVGLQEKSQQAFEHLSGGEKQRALIGRAIVQAPKLLIMDEPTSHLDIKYQIQIIEMAKSLGITVLASFHDLNLASAMCDNLLVMKEGELVKQGAPTEVITETMLSDVFGVCALIKSHPQQNFPHITYFYDYSIENNEKGNDKNHSLNGDQYE